MTAAIQPKHDVRVEPISACYLADARCLEIAFNTGAVYRWPVDSLQMRSYTPNGWIEIPRPADEQLKNVRIWSHGEVVEFADIEQCFEIDQLVRGQLGTQKWMEKLLNKEEQKRNKAEG